MWSSTAAISSTPFAHLHGVPVVMAVAIPDLARRGIVIAGNGSLFARRVDIGGVDRARGDDRGRQGGRGPQQRASADLRGLHPDLRAQNSVADGRRMTISPPFI